MSSTDTDDLSTGRLAREEVHLTQLEVSAKNPETGIGLGLLGGSGAGVAYLVVRLVRQFAHRP